MTCWRRLRDWNDAGVWQHLHESLLAEMNAAGAEGSDRRLPRPGHERRPKTGPSPVDRARTGSKHHLITEAHGIPLAIIADRRKPQRRRPAHAADRGRPEGARPTRTAPSASGRGLRRPWL